MSRALHYKVRRKGRIYRAQHTTTIVLIQSRTRGPNAGMQDSLHALPGPSQPGTTIAVVPQTQSSAEKAGIEAKAKRRPARLATAARRAQPECSAGTAAAAPAAVELKSRRREAARRADDGLRAAALLADDCLRAASR